MDKFGQKWTKVGKNGQIWGYKKEESHRSWCSGTALDQKWANFGLKKGLILTNLAWKQANLDCCNMCFETDFDSVPK